jgi:hypothetical protein
MLRSILCGNAKLRRVLNCTPQAEILELLPNHEKSELLGSQTLEQSTLHLVYLTRQSCATMDTLDFALLRAVLG